MILNYELLNKLAFGIEYLEENNGKYFFSRFSEQERELLDYGRDNSFATAGVKLDFITDSKHLNIEVCAENSNPHGRNFYSFDVCCDGRLVGQIKNYNKEPLYPYKQFSLSDRHKKFSLPDGNKRIKIYFPWSVQGMLSNLEVDDGATVEPVVKKRKMLVYGDSITQGYDAIMPSRSYTSKLAELLDADIVNKGIGGTVFMPEIAEIKKDCIPDIIAVAYGTNDWNVSGFDGFKKRCLSFFENLVKNYPETPILAIAPIWRADSAEKRKFGDFSKIADYLEQISQKYKSVIFIDGIDFIPRDSLYYRDGYLHPNDKGFEFYATNLFQRINLLNI